MLKTARRDESCETAGSFDVVISHLWQWNIGEFCPVDSWTPAVNMYRLERRIEICVDLAGVDPAALEVKVESNRLIIRGYRASPEPRQSPEPMRIVTMEIDHGPFCRIVPLAEAIDLARVTTRYAEGWLWVQLPLREHG